MWNDIKSFLFTMNHLTESCLKNNVKTFQKIELWIYFQLNEDIAGFNLPITMWMRWVWLGHIGKCVPPELWNVEYPAVEFWCLTRKFDDSWDARLTKSQLCCCCLTASATAQISKRMLHAPMLNGLLGFIYYGHGCMYLPIFTWSGMRFENLS